MFRRLPASALGVLRGGAAHFRTKRTIVNTVKAFTTKPPFHTTIVGAAAAAALGFSGAFLSLSTSPASVVAEGTQVTPILAEIAAKVKGIEDALNKKAISLAVTGPTSPGHERPTLVLVHGLDSTRHTWAPFIKATEGQWNVLAVDQRGHGESEIGLAEDFSIGAMVTDLRHTLQEHRLLEGGEKVVLVGHSMGGRIAMAYAAAFPDDLHAVVIEDMDIKPRDVPAITDAELAKRRAFSRGFPSWESAATVLKSYGYDDKRVAGWKVDGRVFQKGDGTWWSGINPMAQRLALEHVLGRGAAAEDAWKTLGAAPFPVLLLVAGKYSACDAKSLCLMKVHAPNAEVTYFPDAFHSIHNTGQPEFSKVISELYSRIHTTTPGRAQHHDEL